MKTFKADDGTLLTFELAEEAFGCQRFKITAEGEDTVKAFTLGREDEEANYKALTIMLKYGMFDFKNLKPWSSCFEYVEGL